MWSFVSTWGFSKQAAEAAAEILSSGGDAMDAVEAGIRLLESAHEAASVGNGGLLNGIGQPAWDAAVMDGNTMKTGMVRAVRGFGHPVTIARAVMEKSRHNILVAEGAEVFARKMGIPQARMEQASADSTRGKALHKGHDTVGAIALDARGKLVVATSAVGTKTRTYGRMGDAPMVGSGFYVESDIGGAAATGLGEDIMRERCSFRCVELMRGGMSPMEAAETAVRTAHDAILRHGGKPGCIALVCMNALGECGAACNYGEFTYAYAREDVEPAVAEAVPVTDQEAGTA